MARRLFSFSLLKRIKNAYNFIPFQGLEGEEQSETKAMTPLPFLEMMCVCSIQFNEALQINVLYPFLVFMIESFGFTGSALGVHAGLLASSFCGAQFISSMLWGRLSDKIGLKPCLIIGTLGSAIVFFEFGFAKTFTQAVTARAFSGLLNGNVGIMKSYVGRITDNTNRSTGFSYLSLAWGE